MGEVPAIRCPLRMSEADIGAALPPPALGEHTREVLQSTLRLSAEKLEALARAGTLDCIDLVDRKDSTSV
jgi:formyl-CoA transferase